jgi:hypothetical protein
MAAEAELSVCVCTDIPRVNRRTAESSRYCITGNSSQTLPEDMNQTII